MNLLEERQRELDRRQGLPERGTPEWKAAWDRFYERADVQAAQEIARGRLSEEALRAMEDET